VVQNGATEPRYELPAAVIEAGYPDRDDAVDVGEESGRFGMEPAPRKKL